MEIKRKKKKKRGKEDLRKKFCRFSRLVSIELEILKYISFHTNFITKFVEILRQEEERKLKQKVEGLLGKIKSWHPWQFFIYRVVRLMLLLRNGQLPPSSMVIYRFASSLTPTYTSLVSSAKQRGWKAIKAAVNSALLFASAAQKGGPRCKSSRNWKWPSNIAAIIEIPVKRYFCQLRIWKSNF